MNLMWAELLQDDRPRAAAAAAAGGRGGGGGGYGSPSPEKMFDGSRRMRSLWDGVKLEVAAESASPVVLHSFTQLDPDLPPLEVTEKRRRIIGGGGKEDFDELPGQAKPEWNFPSLFPELPPLCVYSEVSLSWIH